MYCERFAAEIRRRYVATTDSDHDQPIFPNRTKDVIRPLTGNQVADIAYVAIAVGFAYVAVILDAWSRRVVGYAISRSIDARLTMAALKSAVERQEPPPGCHAPFRPGSNQRHDHCPAQGAHSISRPIPTLGA